MNSKVSMFKTAAGWAEGLLPVMETAKKKLCRFLLHRYLGQFMETHLELCQLSVDIYNGTGTVKDLPLNCQALNEICEDQGLAIEVISGHIGSVTVNIPYDNLFGKNSSVEVANFKISLRPKARVTDGTSMFESMWSSVSSSMQLAQEYLQQEVDSAESLNAAFSGKIEGLENFAHYIDGVLNRVKTRLTDTEIRLEYLPPDSDCGVALIVKIESIDYRNEAGNDPPDQQSDTGGSDNGSQQGQQPKQKASFISTHSSHHITMEGITFYTEEFRIHNPRQPEHWRRRQQQQPESSVVDNGDGIISASEQFLSTISDLPDPVAAAAGVGNEFFSYTSACDSSSSSHHHSYKRTDSRSSTGGAPSEGEEDEGDSDHQEPVVIRSGEIMAARITSKTEIRIKLKEADNLSGPNVELEVSLGCVQLFLTPRQLHSIVLLSDTMLGLNEIPSPTKCAPPDLIPKEQRYDETEYDLKRNASRMSGGVGLNQGWSLADPMLDMIKEQAEFLQSEFRDDGGVSEFIESSNSSMTSSFTSSTLMGSRTTFASRRRMIDPDADADISRFNIRIAAIAAVLLHEDPLVESSQTSANDSPLSEASVQKLQAKSQKFFSSVGNLGLGQGANDIAYAGLIMDSSCDCSHLRLLFTPIIVEGDEQRNRFGSMLQISVSIARADIREVLPDVSVPLLEFPREKNSSALPNRSEISVRFKQTCNVMKGSSGKRFSPPRTEVRFSLAPFLTEFDISILDRLSSLIYQFPFAAYYNQTTPVNSPASPMNVTNSRKLEPKTELFLDAPAIDFRLRFPIPDQRPIHDPQRVPWWQRNVRPDFLLVKLQQARATITLKPHPLYDISANEIQLFYHENDRKSDSVHMGKVVMTDNIGCKYSPSHGGRKSESSQPVGVEYPRIVIEIPSEEAIQKLQESNAPPMPNRTMNFEDNDSDPASDDSFGIGTGRNKDDSPFSAKRVCRESNTSHTKASADDPETLTMPGDAEELDAFCTAAMKVSKLQIRIDLPVVSMQIKSKHLYEVIYNRISTDLLLWAPSAPAATAAAEISANLSASKAAFQEPQDNLANMGMMDSIYVPFTMCKSAIQLDSSPSATNSESESDSDGIFYSVYDRSSRRHPDEGSTSRSEKSFRSSQHHGSRRHQQQHRKASFVDRSNAVSFQLNIGQGMLTVFAPVRDSQKHVIPGQLGEFIIKMQSTYIFSVNGFHGNSNLGYLCIQSKAADVYHCGLIPTPAGNPPLRLVNSVLPSHILSTLYPTPKNLTMNEQRGCPNREMISLAIQIKALPEQNVKRIRIAAGIQLATLRHHFTLPQHSWLTQLMDMIDVVDYPVPGYTPLGVVTEVHVHLWDCAIDYRPLFFPYRSVITLGSLMISSNITTESTGLTLRFIAEDAALCLAPQTVSPLNTTGGSEKEPQRKQSSSSSAAREDNRVTALPSSELVCLVELGLFEISLRVMEKATEAFPKIDMRGAVNDVHLRTCSDSGLALAQIIGYLALEGDLQDDGLSDAGENESVSGLPMGNEWEENLVPVKPVQAPEVTPKQQQRVNSLMADAMEESLSYQSTNSDLSRDDQLQADGQGVEVFFFPDEDQTRAARVRKKLFNSNKRRFASDDDSLSIDEASSIPSSYQDDDHYLKQRPFDEQSEDSGSTNTDMREVLNFERSVMGLTNDHHDVEDEVTEAFPQVSMDLGDVKKDEGSSTKHVPKTENSPNLNVSSDIDEDFCIIADEEKPHYGNQEVPVLEDPIHIIDNHFSVPMGKPDLLAAPKDFPMAVERYTICEMSVMWHLYGGHDFPTEEDKKKSKLKKSQSEHSFAHLPMSEAYKSGVSYSKGSPSVTIGPTPAQKLTWKNRGGPERRHDILMQIQLNKLKFSHERYPPNTEQASRQVLLITDVEILDQLAVSDIKKFMYQADNINRPHKSNNYMIVVKALHIRPNPALPRQECCLLISSRHIRLNIDQDALLFVVNFFSQLAGGEDLNNASSAPNHTPKRSQGGKSTPQPDQPPVMMVDLPEAAQELQAKKMVSENLMLLIEEDEKNKKENQESRASSEMGEESAPIFFRSIVFSSDVSIRVDYHGKRVEMSQGPLTGLLMGLGQLQCSEIVLKKISYRHGILGVNRLVSFLLHEWLQDIKKRQLPKILSGVGPMAPLVHFLHGFFDLIYMPIEQYQKNGSLVQGFQRGAQSFVARSMLALLEMTTKAFQMVQVTAETVYDMLSPGPSVRRCRGNKKGKRKRLHPPQDIREGMSNAIQIVREGISETAHNLVEVTAQEHDQKGYTGAVGAVMRQIPPMVMQPIVLATQATTNVLGGVKNQLVPDARAEAREKYKDDVE